MSIDHDWRLKAEHWELESKRLIAENESLKQSILRLECGSFSHVSTDDVEAASKAIYEHRPYLNHSGKSHMAWSVFRRELSGEYERLKVAVTIGLEAAAETRSVREGK